MYKCWECKLNDVPDENIQMCCSGYMCGCGGMPVEPPICDECLEKLSV
jgi:hypothetical protein